MTSPYRITFCALAASMLLSSCGLLESIQYKDRVARTISPDQVLLVASLGATGSDGSISSYLINPQTLKLLPTGKVITPAPTFLALDRTGGTLYVTNEIKTDATASAYAFDKNSGALTPINRSLVLGEEPTYISVSEDKVVTANYGSGSITMMYREANGALKQADWRIELGAKGTSHPHATVFSPDGKDLFVTDLGQDKIFHFNVNRSVPPLTIDDTGATLPAGSGPRHLIFGRNSDYIYVLAELSPRIFVYKHNGGRLSLVQEVNTGVKSTGAHIAMSPDGRYLYTSYRSGGDGIMVHSVAVDGTLSYVGFTETSGHPRQFALSPDGHYLAVAARDGNQVVFYERDTNFGTLRPTGISIPLSRPCFVLWTGAGR